MSYPPKPSMYGRPEGEQYTQQQIQQQQQAQPIEQKKPTPKAPTRFLHMGQYAREEAASSEHFYKAIGYSRYAGKYQPFEIPDVYTDRSRWQPVLTETPEGLQVSFRPTMRTIGEYAKLGLPVKYAMLGYPVPKIPEGYKVAATKQTSQGIEYTFEPINQPQPSVAQRLGGIEAPTLRSLIGVKTPYYAQGPFLPPETFHPLAGISGYVVAPVESAIYGGMDIYSFATGQQLTHLDYPPWTIKGAPEYTFFRIPGEVILSYYTGKAVSSLGSYVYEASGLKYSHFAYKVSQAKLSVETGLAKAGFKTPEWLYHAQYVVHNWAEETPIIQYGKRLGGFIKEAWLGREPRMAQQVVSIPAKEGPLSFSMLETESLGWELATTPRSSGLLVSKWTSDLTHKVLRAWAADHLITMGATSRVSTDLWEEVNKELKRPVGVQLPYIPEAASQARATLPRLASLGALIGISKIAAPSIFRMTRSSISARASVGVSPIAEAMQIPKVAAVQMVGLRSVQLQKLIQLPSGMGDLTFQMPRFDLPEDLAPSRKRKGKRRMKRRYGMGEFWYPQPPSDLFGKTLKGVKTILG